MAPVKLKNVNLVHKVKGPIRCHTCRLTCRDAEHYLSHACEPSHHSTNAQRFEQQ